MHKINEIVYHDCQRAFDTFASFNTRTNTSACSYYEKAIYDKETIYAKVLGFLSTGLDVKKYHEGDDSKKSFVNAKSDEEMFNDFYHGNGSFHITINKVSSGIPNKYYNSHMVITGMLAELCPAVFLRFQINSLFFF